jgi:hypothetical protein
MNYKEIAKHFRNRLKHEGIAAKCRMTEACGVKGINIEVPSYEACFTPEQQTIICRIATVNKLTSARGSLIVDNGTKTKRAYFEFHGV